MASKKTKEKPTSEEVSQQQRDREAAVFLLNALTYTAAIRNGAVARVRIEYNQRKRKESPRNVVKNTISMEVWQSSTPSANALPCFSGAEAQDIVNDAIAEINRSR